MHKRKLAALAAACGALAATVLPSAASANGVKFNIEKLHLNSRAADNVGYFGPVTTKKKLNDNQYFVALVRGTASFYRPGLWEGQDIFVVCGTPEASPIPPSPGAAATKAGTDVETVFASPVFGGCGNFHPPIHFTNFQIDTGSVFSHVEPLGGPFSSPNKY